MADADGSDDSGDTKDVEKDDETAKVSSGPRFNVNLPGGPKLNFTNQAQKVIVITLVATVLISVIETVHGEPTSKSKLSVPDQIAHTLVGGFIAGSLLLGMSYFIPEFASGLAIVSLVATLVDHGNPFWNTIAGITSNKPKAATPPTTTTK